MDDSESTKLIRHETFYFPFGDLIVQSAPDPDDVSTLFRVNKSLLAYNSPVFAGMFTLPGSVSASTQDIYDGASVVRVSDAAQDLSSLFAALHNPSSLSFPRYDPDIPILLTGVMRLATKYQFDTIRARIVEIMHESWPQSWEQWLRFRSELSVIMKAHEDSEDGFVGGRSYEERIPEPVAAIRFAQEFDVPSILPLAFHTFAGISRDKDWGQSHGEITADARGVFARQQARTARWRLLEITDYQIITHYRELLAPEVEYCLSRFASPEWVNDHLYTMNDDCVDFRCEAKLLTIPKTVTLQEGEDGFLGEGGRPRAFACPDPLGLLETLESHFTNLGLCKGCREHVQRTFREKKEIIWDRIHDIMSRVLKLYT